MNGKTRIFDLRSFAWRSMDLSPLKRNVAVLSIVAVALLSTNLLAQGSVKPAGSAVQADSTESAVDAETQALHDKLAKYLSGTKWTGQFTMAGNEETRTEHYEIISAEKGEMGDYWNLVARIKYGGHDATIPLPPIEIKFAGGTPVITVDNAFFPGFGNFDARVLIRKGQYAGTWAHIGDGGGAGGHMFGTIEKMDAEDLKDKQAKANAKSKTPSK
ncbi:MAG: hypothetical protein ACI814_002856 [Mariniblastus sp.]|jgi:hypothetical protein